MESLYIHIANKLEGARRGSKGFGSIREEIRSWDLWRATAAEFAATFLFVFAGCASTSPPNSDVVRISFCFGLGIMAMVQMVGHISGGHINPAVSIAMAIVFNISPLRCFFYIIAQCIGAIAGAFFLKGVAFEGASLGVTRLNGINSGQGFAIELFLTFVLVAVIFASTDGNRCHFGNPAIVIGLTVTMSHLAAIPFTGSSINPARSLGSAAAANQWEDHWVYWVGPIVGGAAAALLYKYFFDPYRNMPSMDETLQMVTSEKGLLTVVESSDGKKSEAAPRAADNTESASL